MDGVAIGGWSSIVRSIGGIILWWVGIGGRDLYNTVKGLDATGIYDVIPSGRSFLYGLQMYSTWGIFAFAWSIVTFFACFWCRSYLLALLGFVDSMIAASFLVSVLKQAPFIPHAHDSCDGAINWKNGTDGRNYFLVANSTAFGNYGGPSKLCHTMLELWATAISLTVLYGATGLVNIALGIGTDGYCGEGPYLSGGRAGNGPGWLLDYALAPCRFSFRYICRVLHRRKGRKAHGVVQGTRRALACEPPKTRGVDSGEPPMLPSGVLFRISQNLHFVDLVNASHASRRLRITLFGNEALGQDRLDELRKSTCWGTTKTGCGVCGIQICRDCQTKVAIAPSLASKHLRECQPCCSKCFYKTQCRRSAAPGKHLAKHEAKCPLGVRRKADVEMAATEMMALCRGCASMTTAGLRERVEARDERELNRLERHPLDCSKCREMLPPGCVRWWLCRQCFTECPSRMHPVWAEE